MYRQNCNRLMSLCIIFFALSTFQVQGGMTTITNTLEEIDVVEGKIKLNLVYVWGDDETEDINQAFRGPYDIKIDDTGNFFIVDSWNNRIQVFDKTRKFVRTISQKGKGPGDTLNPGKIAFTKNGNIVIADNQNYRIQILTREGKYIHSFPTGPSYLSNMTISSNDELILYSQEKNDVRKWTVSSYDLKGNLLKVRYNIPCYEKKSAIYFASRGSKKKKEWQREYISYFFDDKENFFVSYTMLPFFQKFSSNGKLLMAVSYSTPLKVSEFHLSQDTGLPKITTRSEVYVCSNINVDWKERIFLITKNRLRKKGEGVYLIGGRGNTTRHTENVIEETDMYRLLVFSPTGKIIASKKLPVFVDLIYIHGNRLFIVDSMMGMKIYEYEFEL